MKLKSKLKAGPFSISTRACAEEPWNSRPRWRPAHAFTP